MWQKFSREIGSTETDAPENFSHCCRIFLGDSSTFWNARISSMAKAGIFKNTMWAYVTLNRDMGTIDT
jgi:hypothetical protein